MIKETGKETKEILKCYEYSGLLGKRRVRRRHGILILFETPTESGPVEGAMVPES